MSMIDNDRHKPYVAKLTILSVYLGNIIKSKLAFSVTEVELVIV